MKKCFLLGLICLPVLFVSCVRDLQENVRLCGGLTLTAVTEQPAKSRTVVESDTQVFWEPGDSIKVFCGSLSACFISDLSEKAGQAEFYTTTDGFSVGDEELLWSVYPFSEEAVFDGEAITTILPSRQLARPESFGKDMNLSVARSATSTLQFCNVGGGLRFSVMEEGVREIVLEGMDGEVLAGKIRIGFQDGTPSVLGVTEGKTSISLVPPAGETFQKGKWYFIVTIPRSLEKGFRLSFYKDGFLGDRAFEKPVTIRRSIYGTVTHADEGVSYTAIQDGNISFKDPLVKSILVKYFDIGGDGELSFLEAALVRSFLVEETGTRSTEGKVSIFAGTGITTFDELVYFIGLTRIEDGVFAGCTELSSVTIPETILYIGNNAFKGCTGLKSITLTSSTPPAIGADAFTDTGDCPIYVPEDAVEQYKSLWNEYADRVQTAFVPTCPVPEAVDLGLSVKWASFNLGASKPEEYGDYYAFGETETYYSSLSPLTWKSGKLNGYYWDSYRWCEGSENTWNKYNPSNSSLKYGTVDERTSLDIEDDAAHVNLGGPWRMPTWYEMKELYDHCTAESASVNGVKGFRLTSKVDGYTDKSIFLPASGVFISSHVSNRGTFGHYSSSSIAWSWVNHRFLYPPDYIFSFGSVICYPEMNYGLGISQSQGGQPEIRPLNEGRIKGHSIRPVLKEESEIPVDEVVFDKDEIELSVGETADLIATVLPKNATHTDLYWTCICNYGKSIATVSPSGVVTALQVGSAIVKATSYSSGKSASCKVTVAPPPYTTAAPEAIDLGLVSGLKWASFNLGATQPEEYGDYFAWGETRPYYFSLDPLIWNPGREDGYTYWSYTWCKESIHTSMTTGYTKYCFDQTSGYDGFTDGKTMLDPEDDAAFVNLGDQWRMPIREELEELRSRCTWERTSRNGVEGYLVTGPNGNSVFFPFAGYWNNWNLSDSGTEGRYLSSSLSDFYSFYAYFLNPNSKGVGLTSHYRVYGYSIRPVFVTPLENISLDKEDIVLTVGESASLSATFFPEGAYRLVKWASSNDAVVSVSSTGHLRGMKVGSSVISVTSARGEIYATCRVTVLPPPSPDAIDLGLPSGLKWASFNLGATQPDEYGDYFAWGESEPYYICQDPLIWIDGKANGYTWSSYKWSWSPFNKQLTKYCTIADYGYEGFMDNKAVLDPEDDAARVILGNMWRMPNYEEWNELIKHCSCKRTAVNGVEGSLMTGPNGNSIFLPAAGVASSTSFTSRGYDANYWSSSLNSDNPEEAGRVSVTYGRCWYTSRYIGYPIRPVCSE